MSSPIKNVILFGASGNIGQLLLEALVNSKAFNVSVHSRSTSDATFPAGVKVHKTDMSDEELLAALKGQDALISAVGPMGFGEQKRLLDLAAKAGVKRFLPSEFSVHTNSKAVRDLVPLFAAKWEVIEYLKEQEKEGLTWTGLALGFLFDWGMKQGIFGFNLGDHSATIWDDGNTRFSATNTAAAGQALISVLQHPAETANQYIHVESLVTTQNEVLSELKAASSTEWKVTTTTTEAQVKAGHNLMSQGNFMGMLNLAQASTLGNSAGLNADYGATERLWNSVLDLPMDDLKATVNLLV